MDPMKKLMRIGMLLLVVFFAMNSAWAQSVATAQLGGTVKDPKGAVVPNVTITVRDAAKNFERSTLTAPDGAYQILQLPPGVYTVNASTPGFAKFTAKSVELTVGQTATLPINLSISNTEVVDVNAQAQLVETERTSSTNTIQAISSSASTDRSSRANLPCSR